MLTLLALACAATPASTGCFNGGAFVGAQGGFSHIMLERLAKDKATSVDALADADSTSVDATTADADTKYTSNNGFAGLHVGYLGRVNDKFLVGGLVEGNWVFGQNMKNDQTKQEEKETKARFNVGAYLRAMFNLTEKFMAGADLGFSGQEIRQEKVVGQKDKESKWFWNPAARLVLGATLTDNILVTAHFGGVFPMMKQDSLRDSSVKAKYSNFHGGVGISYVFGG